MKKSFLSFSCFVLFVSSCWGQQCSPLRAEETTRKGFSATVVLNENKPRKDIKGRVVLGGKDMPLADVFVEVFPIGAKSKEKPRAAGCRTGGTGDFLFTELPKGKYIIRLSKDGGYMITEIRVKVDPKSRNKDPVAAAIELGV